MSFRAALAEGSLGVRLELPARLEVQGDWAAELVGRDPVSNVEVRASFVAGLHLVLDEATRGDLHRALELRARAIFEQDFVANAAPDPASAARAPRTADPTWSPMVDVEHLLVDGQPALRTVHRRVYQPDREQIMGHLMVPLAQGLFEISVLANDSPVGPRESMLALASLPKAAPRRARPPQAYFDDPVHDAAFAAHALSRVRAELRWYASEADLGVLEPAPAYSRAEIELPERGGAFEPPPRFVLRSLGAPDGKFTQLSRCSFSAVHGQEFLSVHSSLTPLARSDTATLRAHAEKVTGRTIGLHSGQWVFDLYFEDLAPVNGRPQLLALATYGQKASRARAVLRWFLDDAHRPWFVWIVAAVGIPDEPRLVELDALMRTWRPLGAGAEPPRPWWKLRL
jgi:hypothetical protein